LAALIAVILSPVQLVVVLLRARLGLLDGGERSVAQRAIRRIVKTSVPHTSST